MTPVIHVLQYPGCVPKPIPSFACVGRCASYIQVSSTFLQQKVKNKRIFLHWRIEHYYGSNDSVVPQLNCPLLHLISFLLLHLVNHLHMYVFINHIVLYLHCLFTLLQRSLAVKFGKWNDPVCAVKNLENAKRLFLYSAQKRSMANENSKKSSPKRPWNACVAPVHQSKNQALCHRKLPATRTRVPLTIIFGG